MAEVIERSAENGHCLSTEGLVKSYWRRRVVDEASIEVHGGEVVGLLGPNGAGKTTTFYMVTGFIRPDAGNVLFDGRAVFRRFENARSARGCDTHGATGGCGGWVMPFLPALLPVRGCAE